MTIAAKGTSMVFQIAPIADPLAFVTIAGQKTTGWKKSSKEENVSNKDTGDSWFRIGDGMGEQMFEIDLGGIFSDTESLLLLEQLHDDETLFPGQVLDLDTKKARRGTFKCTDFDVKGPHQKAQEFTIKIKCDGKPDTVEVA